MNPNLAHQIELPHLSRVSGEDFDICRMFNQAAKDIRMMDPQSPELVRDAFNYTLTRMGFQFDEDRIMHALMKGGLQAPSHMMPEKYARFGSDVMDEKQGMTGQFHGALTGARPMPNNVPPAFMLPERAPRPTGLAHHTFDM